MLPEIGAIVFGDVVATGTSLTPALHRLLHLCAQEKKQISSMLFFTIGGRRSTEILSEVDEFCRKQFSLYQGAAVVYLEGCFDVAREHSKLSVMCTDLICCVRMAFCRQNLSNHNTTILVTR